MTEHQDDHREAIMKEPGHRLNEIPTREPRRKGFLNPRTIKLFSFTTMSICIVGSVFVSILAISDFTKVMCGIVPWPPWRALRSALPSSPW
jgi:hypothetical protein